MLSCSWVPQVTRGVSGPRRRSGWRGTVVVVWSPVGTTRTLPLWQGHGLLGADAGTQGTSVPEGVRALQVGTDARWRGGRVSGGAGSPALRAA